MPELHGDPWRSAIPQGSLSPANQNRLDFVNGSAFQPEAIEFSARVRSDNNWNRPARFTNGTGGEARYAADGEIDSLGISLTVPLGKRWAISLEGSVGLWSGGWMDGLIEDFHRAMGIRDHDRPSGPRDQLRVENGSWTASASEGLLGMGTARIQWVALQNARHALALRADLGLPLGLVQRGVRAGLQLGGGLRYSGRGGRFQWDLGAGLAGSSPWMDAIESLTPTPVRFFYDASLTVGLGRGVALVLGHRFAGPLYREGWTYVPRAGAVGENEYISSGTATLFDTRRQFFTALRWDGPRASLHLSLVEDLWPGAKPGNLDVVCDGPDLTLGLGGSYRWEVKTRR
ncbi:MAG: DUF3187 family protein [Spirochaetes bacterium]|nr:DUF3187 family protein [Spirochaetota bacterium]